MSALRVKMRPDLAFLAQGSAVDRSWVAVDPVALRYFQLRDEEYFVLKLLDGRADLDEIRAKFEATFQPLQLGKQQLYHFILRLHEQGLVIADAAGQGDVLHRRSSRTQWSNWQAAWTNPLAIRLPGLAGGPLLDRLYRHFSWIFSPVVLTVCALFVIGTAGYVALEFDSFQQRLSHTQNIFVPQSLLAMMLVMIVIKALHELGHGLVCRHFKAHCQEIGVMLLVGSPTLYCDVTDAWRLPSKWQRILVSSAGMLVELFLAAIATVVWWNSPPGLVNLLAAQALFVCSVGTLGFNLNPLLRCDGYYILSDLIGVPNLWQDARGLLQRQIYGTLFGLDLPDDPTIPRSWEPGLLLYGACSVIYSVLLIGTILYFLFHVLDPQGLGGLAWLALAVIAGSMGYRAVSPLIQSWSHVGRRNTRQGRASVVAVTLLALLALLAFVPVPKTIRAQVWLTGDAARGVYAPLLGKLENIVPAGTSVSAGQTIATLTNAEVVQQLQLARAAVEEQALHVKNIQLLMNADPRQAPLLPTAREALEDQQQRLAHWEEEAQQLTIRAPQAGFVQPPPLVPREKEDPLRLQNWSGSVFEPRNQGCQVDSGTLICHVGPDESFAALLLVDPEDLPEVRPGDATLIYFTALPGTVCTGTLHEISQAQSGDLPAEAVRALQLAQRNSTESAVPLESFHLAKVRLQAGGEPLKIGMIGTARIAAQWEPLLPRWWRYARQSWQ